MLQSPSTRDIDNANRIFKSKRVPVPKTRPVIIKTPQNQLDFFKELQSVDQCSFTVAPSGEFSRIFPTKPENYAPIVEQIEKRQIQHYLIPEKTSDLLKVVLRGLPSSTDPNFIAEDLASKGFETTKVSPMISFKTQRAMPLFQIQLVDTPKNREIYHLTNCLYYFIKVEEYRRPKRALQCHLCQFYHHTQINCRMAPRCVKCAGAHESRECPKAVEGKLETAQVLCCNCGGAHTASYRGCPKFPENRLKATQQKLGIRKNVTYANAATGVAPSIPPTPQATQPSNNSDINSLKSILNEIAHEFNLNSFSDLIFHYSNLLNKIKATSDKMTKLTILMEGLEVVPPPPAP